MNELLLIFVHQYDRAIIDFGDVTITETGSTSHHTDQTIVIEWDAVVIKNEAVDETEDYWVSAGAEFNNETEIWIGQASFNLNATVPVSDVTSLKIDKTRLYTILF